MDDLLDAAAWEIVNDGVMGGISRASLARTLQGLRFAGEIRTEFNGGFASVRRPLSAPAAAQGVALTVAGDGHRYRLTVFTRDPASGRRQPYLYYADFATAADTATEVALRWPQFTASFRGRPVAAPPLAAADVVGLGLMLTKDGHRDGAGSFALELRALRPLMPM